jgi:tRNA G18 (ribose-2'-O)-methylase SpoU
VAGVDDPVGVGPHPQPWPVDEQLDPHLLAEGDRRNVVDRYRYWRNDAVVTDLDTRRSPFVVAVENFQHDFNIGSVVRTANAFNASSVHIVGRRRWNRRGAMVTDRYLHVLHHETTAEFVAWCDEAGLPVLGVDNVPGAVPLETYDLPLHCALVFGQEGPGLSDDTVSRCHAVLTIGQLGSTRSMNVGAAAAIVMHAWVRRHVYHQRPEADA